MKTFVHDVCLIFDEYVPGEQDIHAVDPSSDMYAPVEHEIQTETLNAPTMVE